MKIFILCLSLILCPMVSHAQFIGIAIQIPPMSVTGSGGGVPVYNGQLVYLGQPLVSNGAVLTYNP